MFLPEINPPPRPLFLSGEHATVFQKSGTEVEMETDSGDRLEQAISRVLFPEAFQQASG